MNTLLIKVHSTPGEGTTFRLEIPAVQQPATSAPLADTAAGAS